MALTNEERWKSIDARRRRYLAGNIRIVSNGLVKAIQPIIDSMEEFGDVADIPNRIDDRYIENAYRELYVRTVPEFATVSYREFKKQKSEQVLRDVWMENINRYIETGVIAERITHVTNTTKNRVRAIIQKGINEGMSIEEMKREIDNLGLDDVIRNRSRVIARTESILASNKGTLMGYQSTGLDLRKLWIATADDRTRDDHYEADGQVVDLNGQFEVGGHYCDMPGDPSLPAGQVISCRCTIAGVTQ